MLTSKQLDGLGTDKFNEFIWNTRPIQWLNYFLFTQVHTFNSDSINVLCCTNYFNYLFT